MEAAGIVSALQTPALSNMGSGVIIGIVDTGIDYTSPVFRKSDGTTRILGLWDQTLPEDPSVLPPGVPEYYPMGGASYGTEFTHEEINEALTLEDPFPWYLPKIQMATALSWQVLQPELLSLSRTSQALLPWQILPL